MAESASSPGASSSAPAASAGAVSAADARYTFDSEKLDALRKASPWNHDPRYFKGVAVSPSAAMKMVRCD